MVDAALTGDGYERMAELAASEVGSPVAIVIPEHGVSVMWPDAPHLAPLDELERFLAVRATGRADSIPEFVDLLVPITFAHEFQGGVAMLKNGSAAAADSGEFLHLAAMASATALALEQARELESASQQGGPIEQLLVERSSPQDVASWLAEQGCAIEPGFCAIVVDARASRPHQALALVGEVFEHAAAELVDERIYAIAPMAGRARADRPDAAIERLRSHGAVAVSTSYTDPTELRQALREADLMLDALLGDDPEFAREVQQGASGVYGLLFRVLASSPDELDSFYRDTVEPAARYDEQYSAELVSTLEAYLANDFNMNATARAIHAHRHTVAYRLERVKALTGLDPSVTEDRERLGLGLKVRRMTESESNPRGEQRPATGARPLERSL